MAKILLILSLAAASLAAKDRAWQTGQLLDNDLNPYFKTVSGNGGTKTNDGASIYPFAVGVNVNRSSGDVAYDDYVIAGEDTVYMVEFTRLKSFKPPHLSLSLPLAYAVEKNKLWIKDLDKAEFELQILKQAPKAGSKPGDVVAAVEAKPAPVTPAPAPAKPVAKPEVVQAKAQPAPAPTKPAVTQEAVQQAKAQPAKVEPPKAPAKPDPVLVASVAKSSQVTPKPELKATPPAPKPEPKPVAKVETPKPVQKPEPAAKPEGSSSRVPRERAWQSGQLLSIVSNSYFFNVTYSSDTEGGAWPFVQGSDGRYTVNGQIGNPTGSLYTYDNYVIESQFCVYLVQRMRPKTSMPVRLPGTKALKFAVEKSKLWVLDDDNIEYETKVVKLVQKDAIIDPLTRAAAKQ